MSNNKPGRGADQFPLRFPEGMRDEIKRLAEEDGQSMNTKLIELLKFALDNSGIDVEGLLDTIAKQQNELLRRGAGGAAENLESLEALVTENLKLRKRLDRFEPLLLQTTPAELALLMERLDIARRVTDGKSILDNVEFRRLEPRGRLPITVLRSNDTEDDSPK